MEGCGFLRTAAEYGNGHDPCNLSPKSLERGASLRGWLFVIERGAKVATRASAWAW